MSTLIIPYSVLSGITRTSWIWINPLEKDTFKDSLSFYLANGTPLPENGYVLKRGLFAYGFSIYMVTGAVKYTSHRVDFFLDIRMTFPR